MNIVCGKMGKSILFDQKKWRLVGGDEAGYYIYIQLAKSYPEHNFYFIGKSDITAYRNRCEKDGIECELPENIIDMFEGYVAKENVDKSHFWLMEKWNKLGLKADVGLIMQGPTGCSNLPNAIYKLNSKKEYAKTLDVFRNYAACIIHFLNMTNVPHFHIGEDPRYAPLHTRDLYNTESFVLAQYNKLYKRKAVRGYDELSAKTDMIKVPYYYAGVETFFLMGKEKRDFRKMEKKNLFLMALNEGGKRGENIEKWLLKFSDKIKIYGKWKVDEVFKKYPDNFYEIKIDDAEEDFWDTKYTLILPMLPDWCTQKFWKTIHYGIIPFFERKYDTQKHYDIPKILRVKSPKDMWEKIKFFEENPDEKYKILDHLYNMLDDKYYNGEFLKELAAEGMDACLNNRQPELSKFGFKNKVLKK